jgi:protein-L-isoaspartate O-methyltransferase
MHQELLLVSKDLNGQCHTRDILGVVFVPLVGGSEEALAEH